MVSWQEALVLAALRPTLSPAVCKAEMGLKSVLMGVSSATIPNQSKGRLCFLATTQMKPSVVFLWLQQASCRRGSLPCLLLWC